MGEGEIISIYCKREKADRLHYQLTAQAIDYRCMGCGNVRQSVEVELLEAILSGGKNEK